MELDPRVLPRGRMSGVYCIRNLINGKVYIGCSVNLRGRFFMHLRELRKGSHHSRKLQRAWVKYGEKAFVFEVLVVVEDSSDLLTQEQTILDRVRSFDRDKGYNICHEARNRLGVRSSPETVAKISAANRGKVRTPEQRETNRRVHLGIRQTPETRRKIGAASLGRKHTPESKAKIGLAHLGMQHTEETRKKISAVHKGNKYWLGRKHTEESRKKIREILQAREITPEQKARMAETARRVHLGKVNSEETRRKISLAKMGHPVSDGTRQRMREAWKRRKARLRDGVFRVEREETSPEEGAR